jgi:hypothetical protein
MAFNRLRDIRDRMEEKWTSGEFIFGYEDDINENHNIDYPLLLVIPPNSTLPATEKDPINAHVKEEYEFEVIFAKPYRTSSSNVGANDTNRNLDVIYSLLEAEAYNWLQAFLDSYPSKQVTLVPTPISVEREKNQHNDMVVQIRMGFTVDCFSHAFASFDDQSIRDLTPQLWLRSDVGVKTQYFGGAEVVSEWKDQSGFNNHFSQATSANQPEYKYEMADTTNTDNRHPFLSFDGTNDFLTCSQSHFGNPVPARGLMADHTVFYIAKTTDTSLTSDPLLSLNYETASDAKMLISLRNAGTNDNSFASFVTETTSAGGTSFGQSSGITSGSVQINVRGHRVVDSTLTYFLNGSTSSSVTQSAYGSPDSYGNTNSIHIGKQESVYGFFNVQEIIIFNSALSNAQAVTVMNYLNHKYNIY